MRKRYHASSIASKPHPCSLTPLIMAVKSDTSVVTLVMGGVGGGGGVVGSMLAETGGNHARKLSPAASVASALGASAGAVRLMSGPLSLLWVSMLGSSGFG